MKKKKWWKSKTIWFNAITLTIGVVAEVAAVYPLPPHFVALVLGIGNLLLRTITKSGIE
jgi:hypothetical protein